MSSVIVRLSVAAALIAALFAAAGARDDGLAQQAPSHSCRSACQQRYNECRIERKGAPACDSEYQACLQACVAGRH